MTHCIMYCEMVVDRKYHVNQYCICVITYSKYSSYERKIVKLLVLVEVISWILTGSFLKQHIPSLKRICVVNLI